VDMAAVCVPTSTLRPRLTRHSYNTFLVLYPLGVASETWLIYSAIPAASKRDERFGYALWAVLATYIPGFYTLFTYMLKQRRRILREGAQKKKQ
jgi:very-long-chain (3R)-3-hydroxyacyl-CoA dehydratase